MDVDNKIEESSMIKFNTAMLKDILDEKGYTNPKRVSKKKVDGCINRVFETDQGDVTITTTPTDDGVLQIMENPKGDVTLMELKEVKIESLNEDEYDELEELVDYISDETNVKLFGIIDTNDVVPAEYAKQWGIYYETFLITSDSGNYIYDMHYNEGIELDRFKTLERDITGIHIDSDFELDYSIDHTILQVPKGTLVKHHGPEYMKLIFLSPDLKKGITTVCFGNEPSVDSTKEDIQELGVMESDLDNFDYDPDEDGNREDSTLAKFEKLYETYDFVNSNM